MRILSRQQQMRNGYKEVGHIFDVIEGTPLEFVVKAQDSDKTLRKLANKQPFWCGYKTLKAKADSPLTQPYEAFPVRGSKSAVKVNH